MRSRVHPKGASGFLSFPFQRGGDGLNSWFRLLEKEQREEGFVEKHLADVKRSKLIICQCKKKENPEVLISGGMGSSSSSISHSVAHLLPSSEKEVMFLGEDGDGKGIFLSPVSRVTPQYVSSEKWAPSRELFVHLSKPELHMLGMAIAVEQWRSSLSFCSSCGHPIHQSCFRHNSCQCGKCSRIFFPTVGSAVIVAVLNGSGKVLLCQNKNRPYNFVGKSLRTILAGFSTLGESLEEAAHREVREESNVKLSALTYAGSQPWPFPNPMMMSCYYGLADSSSPLQAEEDELHSVEWVTKEEVCLAFAEEHPDFSLPPWYTASYTLLKAWVEGVVNDEGLFASEQ